MFTSPTKLPHLLSPSDYRSGEQLQREIDQLLRPAWHCVGTTVELSRPGDFLTCDLLGHAIQVRNFAGQLRCLSNVCSHRHCLISSLPNGSSP
ncbi:MAG: Rieske 2Fe-2S domain-containing protein, partial [Planctomycetales bacterium]|nr:Rieske 2Fe-2S domain-containing protein [Planctomycetales bacterium]